MTNKYCPHDCVSHMRDELEFFSLKGLGKKVVDRIADLPKAVVNAVTTPFTSSPVLKPEDFRDAKYGEVAGSQAIHDKVKVGQNIALNILSAGTAGAAVKAVNIGGAAIGGLIEKQNSSPSAGQSLPNEPLVYTPLDQNYISPNQPLTNKPDPTAVIGFSVGFIILVVIGFFAFGNSK
jgi:hypothetical protein